jgi:molecular chaperone IbpA
MQMSIRHTGDHTECNLAVQEVFMTYDFAPLFRTAIGFDRLARIVDNAAQNPSASTYPPYDIEKTADDSYVLTMAVAGFGSDDIEICVQDNTLIVAGRVRETQREGELLHRGIARRAFERRYALADHVEVLDATLNNGLLNVAVRRIVPEPIKPRRIEIRTETATSDRILPTEGQGLDTPLSASHPVNDMAAVPSHAA